VLLNTSIVAERIRKGEEADIPAIMAGSVAEGMHDFTTRLAQLIDENLLDLKTAEKYAPHPEELRSRVRGIDVKSDTLVSKGR
jgi:Tfp pilus assembly ATPase PilU